MKKRQYIFFVLLLSAAIASGIWLYTLYQKDQIAKSEYQQAVQHAEEMYFLGLEQFNNKDYFHAADSFNEAKEYNIQQSDLYFQICTGYRLVQSKEYEYGIKALKKALEMDCPSDMRQLVEKWISYAEKAQERYETENEKLFFENLASSLPYVGLSEEYIGMTALGKPSSTVRHNYEMISGEQYKANLYDFMQGGKVIFTARCVKGKVYQVFDHRTDPWVPSKPSASKPKNDDPYNAKDFWDPEDFYEWYKDDFDGFEDAEEYWEMHS